MNQAQADSIKAFTQHVAGWHSVLDIKELARLQGCVYESNPDPSFANMVGRIFSYAVQQDCVQAKSLCTILDFAVDGALAKLAPDNSQITSFSRPITQKELDSLPSKVNTFLIEAEKFIKIDKKKNDKKSSTEDRNDMVVAMRALAEILSSDACVLKNLINHAFAGAFDDDADEFEEYKEGIVSFMADRGLVVELEDPPKIENKNSHDLSAILLEFVQMSLDYSNYNKSDKQQDFVDKLAEIRQVMGGGFEYQYDEVIASLVDSIFVKTIEGDFDSLSGKCQDLRFWAKKLDETL